MEPSRKSDAVEAAKKGEASQANATLRLLGTDPWVRFDMWAGRAWEMAERASEFSIANGAPSYETGIDPRVAALFHTAEFAKEVAEMVNPLLAVANITDEEDEEFLSADILAALDIDGDD